jgi:malonate-semialdehyde dehydrogenase (acetylating)/methylmalonate-semialdehyde dehydrogenase
LHGPHHGRRGRGGRALDARGGNHIDFFQEYTINQLVGAAFGAAGQRCMALTTAVVAGEVGEARHWMPEVVIILILSRSTRLTS